MNKTTHVFASTRRVTYQRTKQFSNKHKHLFIYNKGYLEIIFTYLGVISLPFKNSYSLSLSYSN